MLKPEYLDALPSVMVELYSQVEQDILADMARRIAEYDYWIPAAEHQRQMLREMGLTQQNIIRALSQLTGKSQSEITRLMREACNDALESDREYYRRYGMDAPTELSEELKKILTAGLSSTNELFKNLTRTTASAGQAQFVDALDRAWLQIQSGAFDYNTAIRNAIKDLSRKGLHAVRYPSGHTDTLEVAVRRATVTGVNQTALKLQWQLADEVGCDLVEITAHAGARPEHALWQGKICSRSGKDKRYPGLVELTKYGSVTGLGGANCRHNTNPYVEGAPRAYSDEQLAEYNAKKYTYNGKKLNEDEAQQIQRYHERQIRRWKRENKAMQAAGQDTFESASKIRSWQERQRDFIRQTGLKRQSDREQIAGFGKSEARKVIKDTAKINSIKSDIHKGQYSLKVNADKQARHMLGDGYVEGRSAITIDLEELQQLVNHFAGTGVVILDRKGEWKNQELVDLGREIGYTVNKEGRKVKTSKAKIHYSKTGVHVVPYSGKG